MVPEEQSIIGVIAGGIKYIFYPLGFAWGESGWKLVFASFTGLIAKEMVVSTMGTLAGMQEDALEMDNLAGTMFGSMITGMAGGWPAAVAFMVFNLLSVPCMAAVAAAAGEFQSRKKLWFAIGYWMGTAYIVSAVVFWFLFAIYKGFWWIDLIVVAVIAIVITAIVLIKKYARKGDNRYGHSN